MFFLILKLPFQALSPPPRYHFSSWSTNDRKTLQDATSDSFSKTDGFSPSSLCILPTPQLPDSFLSDLGELSSLALTSSQSSVISSTSSIHQVKVNDFIPNTDVSPSSTTALPQSFLVSASISPAASSSHDIKHTHKNNTELRKDKDLRDVLGSPVLKVPRELPGTTTEGEHVASTCNIPLPQKGSSVSTMLDESAQNGEEVCTTALSNDLGDQPEPQESDFYRESEDTTEELIKLYIEEDLTPDNLEFPIGSRGDSIVCCEGHASPNINKVF
ncbi:uncharacterized protein LOC136048992 [Cyrtonyx montezumae]|uniref:uncharacterized protein LOC136048992 n=1 Tax=Cyrtonyx montezumae TaxID=9017 RepID=UPI0032DB2256